MGQSPFDIARQRQYESKAEVDALRHTYERDRIQKCMDFFNRTLNQFVAFIEANDYPCAELMEFEGQQCVGYRLYWTSTIEGEIFFSGSPLTLLINERRQVLYVHETSRNGHTIHYGNGNPVRFAMPTNYNEYVAAVQLPYRRNNSGDSLLHGTDLMKWGALMEYFMENYRRYGYKEGDYQRNRWLSDNTIKRDYLWKVEERLLPEGTNFSQYMSRRG